MHMNEDRHRILVMLSENKISASEAEALLDALSSKRALPATDVALNPRYLRVLVEGHDETHGGKVNVRVPFTLIRAGVRLAALLPVAAYGPVNRALKENGIDIDVSKVKPEDLEDLVQNLSELSVDVEGTDGEKVRVFCE
jgi:hypothetical protein